MNTNRLTSRRRSAAPGWVFAAASVVAIVAGAYRASRPVVSTLGEIRRSVPRAAGLLADTAPGFAKQPSAALSALPPAVAMKGDRSHLLRATAPTVASKPFRIESLNGHQSVSVRLIGANANAGTLDAGSAVYRDAFAGTDVVATYRPDRFELLYFVRDQNGVSPLSLEVQPEFAGADLQIRPGGDVVVSGTDHRPAMMITHPVAIDSNGTTRQGHYALEGHRLALNVDLEGLAFPVLIDPSIVIPIWSIISDSRVPGSIVYDAPSQSTEVQMAMDESRQRIVLVRPVRSNQPSDYLFLFGDPWSETWQPFSADLRTPAHGAVISDAERKDWLRTRTGSETWEWNGSRWELNAGATFPPRLEPAMAFSSGLNRIVLFGGAPTDLYPACSQGLTGGGAFSCGFASPGYGGTSFDELGATFEYDGTTWVEKQLPGGPSPRVRASLSAFDTRVVLFGGRALTSELVRIDTQPQPHFPERLALAQLNDTWLYDGERWTRVEAAHPPPPMEAAQMVYDKRRKVAVLVGGVGADNGISIWEFDGSDWLAKVSAADLPDALKTRRGPSVFWNSSTQTVGLFGGSTDPEASCPFSGDDLATRQRVAEFTPSTWQSLAALGCLRGYSHDLWQWDGVTLTQLTKTAPGGVKDGRSVYRQIVDVNAPPPTPPGGDGVGGGTVPPSPTLQTPQWPWRYDRRQDHFELRTALERAYVGGTPPSVQPDSPAPVVVLSGGSGGGTGGSTIVSPLFAPSVPPKAFFDDGSGSFLLFAPDDGSVLRSDGTTWAQIPTSQTPYAGGQNDFLASTWDSTSKRILAFDPVSGLTWEHRDGIGWSTIQVASGPPIWSIAGPPLRHARDIWYRGTARDTIPIKVPKLTYDRIRQRVVMLYEGSVWEFGGGAWTNAATVPPGWTACAAGYSLAYDTTHAVTVATGCKVPGETWTWNGSSWQGPLPGPFMGQVLRDTPTSEYFGTLQLAWNHPNSLMDSPALGGVSVMDADGTLRTWTGNSWRAGPKSSGVSFAIAQGAAGDAYSTDHVRVGNLQGAPTSFFPPLVEDTSGHRLLAFRDGPGGILELDTTGGGSASAWTAMRAIGSDFGSDTYRKPGGGVNKRGYPQPFELWSPDHLSQTAFANAASINFGDPTQPPPPISQTPSAFTENLFWPFTLLRDPDTNRVRMLTNRGVVWELGGEPVSKLGETCDTSTDCGEGYCTVEKVCCTRADCGGVACETCKGATPGFCSWVPPGQPEPKGLCGSGECAGMCVHGGLFIDSTICGQDTQRACGPSASCDNGVLTPSGHCSDRVTACILPNQNQTTSGQVPCPVVNGQPVLGNCFLQTAACPGGLRCASASSCLPSAQQSTLPDGTAVTTGGCTTVSDCAPGFGYCDPATHACRAGGCTTKAECAPGFGYCNPATHTCLAGGCETRADCTSNFNACDAATHLCTPDRASTLAQSLGIQPSTYQPPRRKTPAELAALFAQAGFPQDDQGRIIHPGVTLGGYAMAFDPNLRSPTQGLGTCFQRIQVCLSPIDGSPGGTLDSCVAGLPRCVTDTPWDGNDPAGEDCCPEACLERYLEARQTGPASAADVFTESGCYPGTSAP